MTDTHGLDAWSWPTPAGLDGQGEFLIGHVALITPVQNDMKYFLTFCIHTLDSVEVHRGINCGPGLWTTNT